MTIRPGADIDWRVRALPGDDASRRRTVEILTLAFADDPVARSVAADRVPRTTATRGFFTLLLGNLQPGVVRVVGEPIVGVGIWLPWSPSGGDEGDLLAGLELPDPAHVERFREAIGALADVHRAAFDTPHLYLMFLAVHADARGAGAGSALLTALDNEADAAGSACGLEEFGETNRVYYARRGYEVAATARVPFSDEPVTSMIRPARRAAESQTAGSGAETLRGQGWVQ